MAKGSNRLGILLETIYVVKIDGALSRLRRIALSVFGSSIGKKNRFEKIRYRYCSQISIGDGNSFTSGCWIWPNRGEKCGYIDIGNGNYFNRNVMIDACNLVSIGNDNMFGPDVYITDSNHSIGKGKSVKESPMLYGHVKIGNGCWLGAKSIILSNVELGDNCIVGAGSVVTKSFPAGSRIAGIPATDISNKAELETE